MLSGENLRKKLRELVKDANHKRMTQAAKFYAEKLVALSRIPEDVYTLALAYHDSNEFRRAVTLIKSEQLTRHNIKFTYLVAKCLYECKELDECCELIGSDEDEHEALNLNEENDWRAAMFMLKGRTWEAMENLENAVEWYKRALTADPFCYEAFDVLIGQHLLPHSEEKYLIETLSCSPDGSWIKVLYSCLTSKYSDNFLAKEEQVKNLARTTEYDTSRFSPLRTSSLVNQNDSSAAVESPSGPSSQGYIELAVTDSEEESKPGEGLEKSIDVQLAKAEWHSCRGSYSDAYIITKKLLGWYPEAWNIYPVHLACCLELKKQTELYQRGQELSRIHPDGAVTWFAFGVYYVCIKRHQEAIKSFQRSHTIDKYFAPAWIAFGNAFAAQAETEQAMAAYRTAHRLFPGLHLPSLYIGMENLRLNKIDIAESNFKTAYALCPGDPLVSNELGVLEYYKGNYERAVTSFQKAIEKIPKGEGITSWEAIFVNLGHALRKQSRYEESLRQYEKALVYKPDQSGTYTALGFTYHLQGRIKLAIENYQAALVHDKNDQFAQDMLQKAVEDRIQ